MHDRHRSDSARSRRVSSSDSLLLTISARLDRVSPYLSGVFLVGALGASALLYLTVIEPASVELEKQTAAVQQRQAELDHVRQECREKLDELNGFEDPYYVQQVAIERFGFRPADGGQPR